jgi:uncharacterized protein (DUF58 family)
VAGGVSVGRAPRQAGREGVGASVGEGAGGVERVEGGRGRGRRALATPGLSPAGRAVLAGAAVSGVAGWVLGHGELLAVAVVGVAAVVLAVPWAWSPPAVEAERAVAPARVSRGDPAEAHLRVRRGGGWRPAVVVRDRVAGTPLDIPVPRGLASFESRYRLPTGRRGVVAVGPLAVVRSDPLGLVGSTRVLGEAATLWVYPRAHAVAPLGAGRRRDLEGPTEDRASGSITFHALREYVPGDDLRLVHWLSTARTGTLMVRQQVDPSQPHTTVVLDTRAAAYPGTRGVAGRAGRGGSDGEDDFEEAVDVAASLVVAATSRRFPVRLLTTSGMVAGGRSGQTQARPLLDDLTTVQLDGASGASGRRAGGPANGDAGRGAGSAAGAGSAGSVGTSLAEVARQGGELAGRCLLVVTGRPPDGELGAVAALGRQVASLAVARIDPGSDARAVRGEAGVEVVAADAAGFAALWGQVT